MRIAVISDVHSNIEALTAVLKVVDEQRVDRVVCLGDVVGYGASVNECCDLVRSTCEATLLGNHDAAVAGRMDYSFYYDAARHALDWSAGSVFRSGRCGVSVSEQVPSDEWVPLSDMLDEMADAWFKPDGEKFTYLFRIPQDRFHAADTSRRPTI